MNVIVNGPYSSLHQAVRTSHLLVAKFALAPAASLKKD